MTQKKNIIQTKRSFFESFTVAQIFEHVNTSNTLLEVAQKLGFTEPNGLNAVDYAFFNKLKTRANWKTFILGDPIGWEKEKTRTFFIQNISADDLQRAVRLQGINSLSVLAVHFLMSFKHGRGIIRARLLELNINLPDLIYFGVHGESTKPLHWPTKYYEKQNDTKPMFCPVCGFQATKSRQIELHHPTDMDYGPKTKRHASYYQEQNITPICANCHTLEHREGTHLLNDCGAWHRKLPGNRKYKNPSDIFNTNCVEKYQLQKDYYLKWYFKSPEEYKCAKCGVSKWGPNNKLLSLELHHVDNKHTNSTINNLMLLCPNCHRSM